ncbi:MAG: trypsin-like peptidase domain-containing protein [Deltaproteobacteria bacterium]|nr:trypsin-like peptidase domain-containing protein [Deltaproteobacteria bacterium]
MNYIDWNVAIEIVEPHVVRIMTPRGSGTGFLVSASADGITCAVATAAHVVADAHYWEQPIRITHQQSGKSVLLRSAERAIILEEANDTAAVIFSKADLPLPAQPLELAPEGKFLKFGNEIGWLGFPAVAPAEMCFFSGRVSAVRKSGREYLVDGVAINGVSGGPAFWNGGANVTLIGVMSAYIANRATGETLPGLTVIQNVDQFHEISKVFKNVDEAKKQETPPEQPPASPTEPST